MNKKLFSITSPKKVSRIGGASRLMSSSKKMQSNPSNPCYPAWTSTLAQSWLAPKSLLPSITTLFITKKTPSGKLTISLGQPIEVSVPTDPNRIVKQGNPTRSPLKILMYGTHLLHSKRGSQFKKSTRSTQPIKIIKLEIFLRKRRIKIMEKKHFSMIDTLTETGLTLI